MRRLFAAALLASCAMRTDAAPATVTIDPDIARLLQEQAAAWNRGDLDAVCAIYADDATFVTPTGMTRGRQAVLDRYRKKYVDKKGMGSLTLEAVETRALGSEASRSAVARWTLVWPDKPAVSGLTLLVFVKTKDGWRILQDASM